jgi:hypothetical protein
LGPGFSCERRDGRHLITDEQGVIAELSMSRDVAVTTTTFDYHPRFGAHITCTRISLQVHADLPATLTTELSFIEEDRA